MLQPALGRTLRHQRPWSCTACSSVHGYPSATLQTRHASGYSPFVLKARKAAKREAEEPQGAIHRQATSPSFNRSDREAAAAGSKEYFMQLFHPRLAWSCAREGWPSSRQSEITEFVFGVHTLLEGEGLHSYEAFSQMYAHMRKEHEITDDEILLVSRMMLSPRRKDFLTVSLRMLHGLCIDGHVLATIILCKHFMKAQIHDPKALKHRTFVEARRKLAIFAKEYSHAAVLEANLLYHLRDARGAVKAWEKAVAPLRDYSRHVSPRERLDIDKYSDFSDLESPWIEAARHHISASSDWADASVLLDEGIRAADPLAHYERLNVLEQGEMWLSCITKAAASGHVVAAHELGIYYSNLDRSPTSRDSTDSDPGWWTRAARAFGLVATPDYQDDPEQHMQLSHTFPADPIQKRRLALKWLQVGIDMAFAPSYLYAAILHLQETLPFEGEGERKQINNPFYSPDTAKSLIDKFFAAVLVEKSMRTELILARAKVLQIDAQSAAASTQIEGFDLMGEGRVIPKVCQPFIRFPDVRKEYTQPGHVRLFDPILQHVGTADYPKDRWSDLGALAESICDKQKWDISLPLMEGMPHLVYSHNTNFDWARRR